MQTEVKHPMEAKLPSTETEKRKTKLPQATGRRNSLVDPKHGFDTSAKNRQPKADKLYSVVHLPHLNTKTASLAREVLRCSRPHA